jgi:hypothetical protein
MAICFEALENVLVSAEKRPANYAAEHYGAQI